MVDLQALSEWAPGPQDVAILALTALVLWWMNDVRKNWNKKFPPGPTRWPIVGNFFQLRKMHQDLANFKEKYGPVFSVRLGSIPLVVITNHQYTREFCRTHDANYAFRPTDSLFSKYLFGNGEAVAIAPVGDHWRAMRKVLATEIFIPKRLRVYKDQRLDLLVNAFKQMFNETNEGKLVDIKEHLVSLMYNVVTQMVMGKTLFGTVSASSKDQTEFRKMTEELFSLLSTFAVKDWFPWTRMLGDFQGLERRMKDTAATIDEFLQATLDGHRQAKLEREERRLRSPLASEQEEKEDYVDVLLQMEGEGGRPFTDRERKLLLQPLLTGGTESSSTVILWTVSELVKNPQWMKRVQDEIESVVGRDSLVQEQDLPKLPTLIAVLKESLRLHPSASYLLPRHGLEDRKVGEYDIPTNARVLISLWALHRDETVWENPLEFNPDRFTGSPTEFEESHEFNGSSFKYMPFGAGRRLCPGMNLGLLMSQLGTANLVHLCNLTLPDGVKPEDMDFTEKPGVNLLPLNPVKVRVTPRLAPELYETPVAKPGTV